MSATVAPSGLADRLGLILAGLRGALARRAARDRAMAVLLLVLHNRLSRLLARVTAIATRYQAGRQRPAPSVRRQAVSPPHPPPRDPLPRQPAWVVRRAPDCAAFGEQLRHLLAEPEMAAMIAAAPQLRRLLRPLWRMLQPGPPPPLLQPLPPPPPLATPPAGGRPPPAPQAAGSARRPVHPPAARGAAPPARPPAVAQSREASAPLPGRDHIVTTS